MLKLLSQQLLYKIMGLTRGVFGNVFEDETGGRTEPRSGVAAISSWDTSE